MDRQMDAKCSEAKIRPLPEGAHILGYIHALLRQLFHVMSTAGLLVRIRRVSRYPDIPLSPNNNNDDEHIEGPQAHILGYIHALLTLIRICGVRADPAKL